MDNKPILFLDHDYVICLEQQFGSHKKNNSLFNDFDEDCIIILKQIIDKTNCNIVITSDWRLRCFLKEMQEYYLQYNITNVIDFTKDLFNDSRSDEIGLYLKEHSEISKYCVVDDLNLTVNNFVRITTKEGLNQLGIKDKILQYLL
jgi:hypothetical protein